MDRFRLSVLKPVTEEWYGCYHVNLKTYIDVMVFEELKQNGYRVALWGNDDFGMEKSFTAREEAIIAFHEIIDTPELTQELLISWGYDRA